MRQDDHPGSAPDYTNAFLCSALALVFLVLGTIWVVFGFLVTLLVSWATDRAIVSTAARRRSNR